MSRGGYRPGAGRPKGAASVKRLQAAPEDVQRAAREAQVTPLEYMLAVMNDPEADPARRDRMAIAAAPYCHPRAGEAAPGKKEQKEEAARQRAQGRFAPPPPPPGVSLN